MKQCSTVRKQWSTREEGKKLHQDIWQWTPPLQTFSQVNATIFYFVVDDVFFVLVVVDVSFFLWELLVWSYANKISTRWTRHQICIHKSGRGSKGGGRWSPPQGASCPVLSPHPVQRLEKGSGCRQSMLTQWLGGMKVVVHFPSTDSRHLTTCLLVLSPSIQRCKGRNTCGTMFKLFPPYYL